jgi:hypothetical protein
MDFDLAELTRHIRDFNFARDEWVAIRKKDHPPESVNPSGSGRFHHIGSPAYYAASGIETARCEVFGDVKALIATTHDVFSFREGIYTLFDSERFLECNPNASGLLDPNSHEAGQKLRTALQAISCSGVMYRSVRHDGGINASVWPLDHTPLASGALFRPYTGSRQRPPLGS